MPRKTNKRKSLKGGFWPFSSSSNVSQPEQLDTSGNPVKKGFFSTLFGNSSSKQQQPLQPPKLEQPLQPPKLEQPQEPIQTIEKKPEFLGGKRKNKSNKKSKKSKKNKTIKTKK
jgi:hypothetical protein